MEPAFSWAYFQTFGILPSRCLKPDKNGGLEKNHPFFLNTHQSATSKRMCLQQYPVVHGNRYPRFSSPDCKPPSRSPRSQVRISTVLTLNQPFIENTDKNSALIRTIMPPPRRDRFNRRSTSSGLLVPSCGSSTWRRPSRRRTFVHRNRGIVSMLLRIAAFSTSFTGGKPRIRTRHIALCVVTKKQTPQPNAQETFALAQTDLCHAIYGAGPATPQVVSSCPQIENDTHPTQISTESASFQLGKLLLQHIDPFLSRSATVSQARQTSMYLQTEEECCSYPVVQRVRNAQIRLQRDHLSNSSSITQIHRWSFRRTLRRRSKLSRPERWVHRHVIRRGFSLMRTFPLSTLPRPGGICKIALRLGSQAPKAPRLAWPAPFHTTRCARPLTRHKDRSWATYPPSAAPYHVAAPYHPSRPRRRAPGHQPFERCGAQGEEQ